MRGLAGVSSRKTGRRLRIGRRGQRSARATCGAGTISRGAGLRRRTATGATLSGPARTPPVAVRRRCAGPDPTPAPIRPATSSVRRGSVTPDAGTFRSRVFTGAAKPGRRVRTAGGRVGTTDGPLGGALCGRRTRLAGAIGRVTTEDTGTASGQGIGPEEVRPSTCAAIIVADGAIGGRGRGAARSALLPFSRPTGSVPRAVGSLGTITLTVSGGGLTGARRRGGPRVRPIAVGGTVRRRTSPSCGATAQERGRGNGPSPLPTPGTGRSVARPITGDGEAPTSVR